MTDPLVEAVGAAAYSLPTDQPEADGTIAWDHTAMVVVTASSEGYVGTGWTYAPAAAAGVVSDLLAPVVTGQSALAPREANVRMVRAVRNAGRGGIAGMALSAVDIALWDLGARILGLPLTRWWGGSSRPVPVYGSGGFTTYSDETLCAQLDGWTGLGIPRVKIKIGESWGRCEARDLRRTALVRERVGDDVEVFVDANGGYSVGQACRVGRRLDELGVTWFEEPVSSDDHAGLARVRSAVAADVAAGEYGHDAPYFDRLAPYVACLQVDVTRCGGYTGWLAALGVAEAHHLDVSAHCAPYLTVPVASVTPRVRHLEWFHDHVRIVRELVDGYSDPVGGELRPLDAPGHGMTLRAEAAQRYRVA